MDPKLTPAEVEAYRLLGSAVRKLKLAQEQARKNKQPKQAKSKREAVHA